MDSLLGNDTSLHDARQDQFAYAPSGWFLSCDSSDPTRRLPGKATVERLQAMSGLGYGGPTAQPLAEAKQAL
jgi:hypothetical protein